MQDDREFNICFVGLVEGSACLYDYEREDYHLSHVQEQAWTIIAEQIGKGVTVTECKARWKNLRGSFTKHLKKYVPCGSGASSKRPYYLAEHMAFILPFTKTRQAKGNISQPTKSEEPDVSDEEVSRDVSHTQDAVNSESEKSGENSSPMVDSDEDRKLKYEVASQEDLRQQNKRQTITRFGKEKKLNPVMRKVFKAKRGKGMQSQVSLEGIDKSVFEYFENKKNSQNTQANVSSSDDGDRHFLLSLLPDLKRMTNRQKRIFKVEILNLAGQILDEP